MNRKHPELKTNDLIKTKYGFCRVLDYQNHAKVTVKFVKTGFVKTTSAKSIREDTIRDPYYPQVFNVGWFGEGKHKGNTKTYALWLNMLERCYSEKSLARYPSYRGCTVVKRWLNYQTFADDIIQMPNWNISGFHLDKDLRKLGNKKYGPKYCSFVPKEVNTSLLHMSEAVGYTKTKSGYVAEHHKAGLKVYLGTFKTKKSATKAYVESKADYLKGLARKYKNQLHKEVYETLLSYTGRYS